MNLLFLVRTFGITTDGSEPSDTNGLPYIGPISIETTTTLRAAAFREGYQRSEIETNTYLFLDDVINQGSNPEGFPATWGKYSWGPIGQPVPADYEMNPDRIEEHADTIIDDLKSIPTMSIVMDGDDLFDEATGIYSNPFIDVEIRERSTSIEYFDPKSDAEFQIDAGIRLFGGWSKHFYATPKKSFALKFKTPLWTNQVGVPTVC